MKKSKNFSSMKEYILNSKKQSEKEFIENINDLKNNNKFLNVKPNSDFTNIVWVEENEDGVLVEKTFTEEDIEYILKDNERIKQLKLIEDDGELYQKYCLYQKELNENYPSGNFYLYLKYLFFSLKDYYLFFNENQIVKNRIDEIISFGIDKVSFFQYGLDYDFYLRIKRLKDEYLFSDNLFSIYKES